MPSASPASPRQANLFAAASPQSSPIDLPDADIELWPELFDGPTSARLFAGVHDSLSWQQETIRIHGRTIPVPRLTAWCADVGRSYAYSGIALHTQAWTPAVAEIKAVVEGATGDAFTGVLVNLYRDGRDSVAWHSDDEAELGPAPVIASVSLGATRSFQLRHRFIDDQRHRLELVDGSLLVMRGATQRHWRHQVPKTARPVGPRINLTFRQVAPA